MMYLQLFFAFFKTGLFAMGGGLATLPFLYEISEKYGWFSSEMIADMLAISESTPGPIGVNMATYAGFTTAGVGGAVLATAGLVLPSLLIVLCIAAAISRFRNNRYVENAFSAIRPAVVAMIFLAFVEVLKASVLHLDAFMETRNFASLFHLPALVLFLLFYALYHFGKKIHPIVLVLLGALAGIILGL
mgnify:CR=1 FL=1